MTHAVASCRHSSFPNTLCQPRSLYRKDSKSRSNRAGAPPFLPQQTNVERLTQETLTNPILIPVSRYVLDLKRKVERLQPTRSGRKPAAATSPLISGPMLQLLLCCKMQQMSNVVFEFSSDPARLASPLAKKSGSGRPVPGGYEHIF